MNRFNYPSVRRDEHCVDDFHGQPIVDPYRWLEDSDSNETKQFVEEQNLLSRPYIDSCAENSKLNARLTELWNYPRQGCPFKYGSAYYYFYNSGLQNQSVLYQQRSLTDEGAVFLDPNEFSADGTVALSSYAFSEDGRYFAYGLSEGGVDWFSIKVRDVESGQDLPERLDYAKFSGISWTHDHKGFFYARYPKPQKESGGADSAVNLNHKVYYHRLDTAQSDDVVVLEFPEQPHWVIGASVTDDGHYVVLSAHESCQPKNLLFVADLRLPENNLTGLLKYTTLVGDFLAEFDYITNEAEVFTFRTDLDATRYRLINIDLAAGFRKDDTITLVSEHAQDVLDWAACVAHDKLVLCYLKDAKNILYCHSLKDGQRLYSFDLDVGAVNSVTGRKYHNELFYRFASFTTPGDIYRVDFSSDTLAPQLYRRIELNNFDATTIETKQVFYESADGTRIPMFVLHRKGAAMDGSRPCLLYGYGGFNISLTPSFSLKIILWLQHFDGVYAVANIRGGGEYGMKWYDAGRLACKQNVFDDFVAAARYLVSANYTRPERLCINGGSNGGLLVTACANQHPALFKCVVADVGVLDMLRFHKFTIGKHWVSDFGCAEKPDEFQWLIKYSPLHNIPSASELATRCSGDNEASGAASAHYPATLLTTADHDDRVVQLHSFKFIAELQYRLAAAAGQASPLMVRIETKAGHGAGKPTSKQIEELVDKFCFICNAMHLQWSD